MYISNISLSSFKNVWIKGLSFVKRRGSSLNLNFLFLFLLFFYFLCSLILDSFHVFESFTYLWLEIWTFYWQIESTQIKLSSTDLEPNGNHSCWPLKVLQHDKLQWYIAKLIRDDHTNKDGMSPWYLKTKIYKMLSTLPKYTKI